VLCYLLHSSGDSGAEAGLAWLQSVSDAGNLALLDGPNIPGQGYFATVPNTQLAVDANSIYLDDPVQLRNNATWANSVVLPQDGNGNTVSYIIERMCLNQTAPDTEHCLFGANPPTVNAGDSGYQQAALADGLPSPMYRVTVRVQGPKNTESYTQTYAY